MEFYIRTDASLEIGTGHTVRCQTLAELLKEKGFSVVFLCQDRPGNRIEAIRQAGFAVHSLPVCDSEVGDLENCRRALGSQKPAAPKWMVVDHYGLSAVWESGVRALGYSVLAIDDLADRQHACSILLDQNLYLSDGGRARYSGKVETHTQLLLGPAYALLRPQFYLERRRLSRQFGVVERILVFFGGVDLTNETAKALDALVTMSRLEMAIDVVLGASNPHQDSIRSQLKRFPKSQLHIGVTNMASLMAKADLSLGAGGTTSWERCCMGLPSLIWSVASNQNEICHNLGQIGAAVYLGWHETVSPGQIAAKLDFLFKHREVRAEIGQKARNLVDGQGGQRVLEAILS